MAIPHVPAVLEAASSGTCCWCQTRPVCPGEDPSGHLHQSHALRRSDDPETERRRRRGGGGGERRRTGGGEEEERGGGERRRKRRKRGKKLTNEKCVRVQQSQTSGVARQSGWSLQCTFCSLLMERLRASACLVTELESISTSTSFFIRRSR